jgi:3-methyladenine DNA glycosylase AlkD
VYISLINLKKELHALAAQEKAINATRFFKTSPGQYADSDVFIGVTIPEQRKLARKFKDLANQDIITLLKSKLHEERSLALILWTNRYAKANPSDRESIVNDYLDHLEWINNWDLVDTSRSILGEWVHYHNDSTLLDKLVRSKNLWHRRVGIVSTHTLILRKNADPTLRLCAFLLSDTEPLIHKACGWMLREIGKHIDQAILLQFLDEHSSKMPSIMLSYASEHLNLSVRKKYQATRIKD